MAQLLPYPTEAANSGLLPPDHANAHSAYDIILTGEKEARENKSLVRIRTLGYLLLRPMSNAARDAIADEVLSCQSKKDPMRSLDDLGSQYVDTLLTLCECHSVSSTGCHSSTPA